MLEIMGLNKDRITSLELLDQINIFRKQEGNRAVLQHKDLLKIIRDEFEEEIDWRKISPMSYKDSYDREQPMFVLSYNQAKQVLLRESKFVRRAVIHYVEKLEEELQKDFIEKYERQLLGFDELAKRNEKLEYNNGNGKYYKSINNIEWWKDYFILDKKGLGRKLTEELIRLSGELNIAYDGIYPTFSNNEVLVFHIKTYEEFRKRLRNDTEFRILPAYRKRF
nr:MAG TPA: KilAC domain protein [Caudoviricetes sp.]